MMTKNVPNHMMKSLFASPTPNHRIAKGRNASAGIGRISSSIGSRNALTNRILAIISPSGIAVTRTQREARADSIHADGYMFGEFTGHHHGGERAQHLSRRRQQGTVDHVQLGCRIPSGNEQENGGRAVQVVRETAFRLLSRKPIRPPRRPAKRILTHGPCRQVLQDS